MSNFPLRLPDHVASEAKQLAAKNRTSLNQFLSTIIAERIGELRAIDQFEIRAARGDPKRALEILTKVPERPPVPRDELPEGL